MKRKCCTGRTDQNADFRLPPRSRWELRSSALLRTD